MFLLNLSLIDSNAEEAMNISLMSVNYQETQKYEIVNVHFDGILFLINPVG